MDITELLSFSVQHKASDLHLSSGVSPMIRVDGDVRRINIPALADKDVNSLVYDIMNDNQRKDYEQNLEVDFSFEVPNLARFRVNAFNSNRGPAAVFRTIPSDVLTLEDLGAPDIFKTISDNPRGLVLVTGPTGSGKSTTLAAMVDYINQTKHHHILTSMLAHFFLWRLKVRLGKKSTRPDGIAVAEVIGRGLAPAHVYDGRGPRVGRVGAATQSSGVSIAPEAAGRGSISTARSVCCST